MDRLIEAATSYPTAILSVLLVVVLVYWLLALVGWVDFHAAGGHVGLELQADGDPAELTSLAGFAMALGLNGVPFSIVLSALILLSWTWSALAGEWLMPLVPTTLLYTLVGTGVLVLSAVLALPLTVVLVRPLRGLFVTHQAVANASLVGQACVILSLRVDERTGYASVAQRGAHLQIQVWAPVGNALTKGSSAHIVEYDAAANRYLVQPSFFPPP